MSPAEAIAEAHLPERHIVAGVVLRPFSVWHWLACQRFQLSFFTNSSEHTLGDLLLGVLICSRTREEFSQLVFDGALPRMVDRWRYDLAGGHAGAVRRFIASLRGNRLPVSAILIDLPAACEAFQAYLDAHGAGQVAVNEWSVPIVKHAESGTPQTPRRAPYAMHMLDGLVSSLHIPERDAWNMGLPEARWRFAIHAEREGALEIVDNDQAAEDQRRADEYYKSVMESEQARN